VSDEADLRAAFARGASRAEIAELSRARSRARRGGQKSFGGVYATGIEEIDAALADMPRGLQAKGARKGTRAAAKVALETAIALAPVKTGALEQSLRVRAMKRSRRDGKRFDVGHTVLTGESLFQGEQFYGGFLEFGTGPRWSKGGKYRGLIAEHVFDYLRPAIYADTAAKYRAYIVEVAKWLRSIGRASARTQDILDGVD
jgi:HK97 gp10 family phage protein